MKQAIQQLIEQHKLFKQEAEEELQKGIEIRSVVISELEELLSF